MLLGFLCVAVMWNLREGRCVLSPVALGSVGALPALLCVHLKFLAVSHAIQQNSRWGVYYIQDK